MTLTTFILGPVVCGIVLLVARGSVSSARSSALTVTGIITLLLLGHAGSIGAEFSRVERYDWARLIGFEYHLALDGISYVFVLLTCLVMLMSLLAAKPIATDTRFYGLMLLLEGGLIGTFTAQNFLHFFLFWELSLIPAFFLVKNYGGAERAFAATQFFVYTMVGSVAMLIGFLALYLATGTLDLAQLAQMENVAGLLAEKLAWTRLAGDQLAIVVFLLAFAGVAVKVPLWPLHSWQPLTYSEAPTPVTMTLTGIMSKMGVYGLIRLIFPIFPEQIHALHRPLLALAVITVLYGAWAAFAQRDLKRLFAYSSLSHLGYCFLAVFAASKSGSVGADDRTAAINGVLLQVLSHGLIAAALFAFVGFLEQRGSRSIHGFGGLRAVNPRFAGMMGIALFASLGLPGLSGFPAEFLIFKGSFPLAPVATGFAVLGLLLTAAYILNFYGKVFYGPLPEGRTGTADLTAAEKLVVLPAIIAAFVLGLAPQIAIRLFNGSVLNLVQQL